jgi:hypothetical protein
MNMKLYDIVWVRHDAYSHYGEIFSRVTPGDTYMVRMVPGHPGTLREISAKQLSPTTGRIRWVHYAQIAGPFRDGRAPRPGSFPIDMLRRDNCAPLNFNIETMEIDPTFGFDRMVVAKASDRRHALWTHERWQSFLWGVKELRSEELK